MRFSRAINMRGVFGATPIRAAAHLISIFLIKAVALNAQILPPGNSARLEARVIAPMDERILSLLAALADKPSLSADLTFAVRAQSQAATLLWPYDGEEARAIYHRAFQSLVCNDSATPKAASVHRSPRLAISPIARRHLLVELLQEIAGRDPGLAENLARATMSGNYDNSPAFDSSPSAAHTESEVERRNLLFSVALQIVERDPTRAMALARLSLASG